MSSFKGLLEAHGLGPNEIATIVGVSKVTIYAWISGKSVPRKKHLAILKARFNLTEEDIKQMFKHQNERRLEV